jgi:hypothetical protein
VLLLIQADLSSGRADEGARREGHAEQSEEETVRRVVGRCQMEMMAT